MSMSMMSMKNGINQWIKSVLEYFFLI